MCVSEYIYNRRYGWFTWRGVSTSDRAMPLKGAWVETFCYQLKWVVSMGRDRWHNPHRYSPWRPTANLSTSCTGRPVLWYLENILKALLNNLYFSQVMENIHDVRDAVSWREAAEPSITASMELNAINEQQIVAWEFYGHIRKMEPKTSCGWVSIAWMIGRIVYPT